MDVCQRLAASARPPQWRSRAGGRKAGLRTRSFTLLVVCFRALLALVRQFVVSN